MCSAPGFLTKQDLKRLTEQLLCRDPNGAMISFADMMKKQIVMPAHLMSDGVHTNENGRNLFKDFSSVAQSTGTYTGHVNPSSGTPHHLSDHKYQ